jgi:hypothetical protein
MGSCGLGVLSLSPAGRMQLTDVFCAARVHICFDSVSPV